MVPEPTGSGFARSLAFYTQGVGFEVAFSRAAPAFAYLDFEGALLMTSESHQDGWNAAVLSGQRVFLVRDPDGHLLRPSGFLGERDKTTYRADLERGRDV